MVYTVFMPRTAADQRAVWGDTPIPFPAAYHPVGRIAAQDLEEAWRFGQNDWAPEGSWNPDHPTRSLTVGDVLVDERGHAWRIERAHFTLLASL